jgi:hypothetical protein
MNPANPGDPNQQHVWNPPPGPGDTGVSIPPDAEPSTSGDKWALIALTVSISLVLSSCIPGFGCLAPLVAGIIALTQAKKAARPDRARTYAWVSIGIGGLILVLLIAIFALYGTLLMSAINAAEPR